MDQSRLWIIYLLALTLTFAGMVAGFLGIFAVALFATALTVGLKTGSLAPYYPTVSRTAAPTKYWLVMSTCALVVVANILTVVLRR
jgi:hypothetical protein